MTAIVSICLAIMAIFNAKFGKSYLYPPAIYSATWSFLLMGLAVSGETFYPLSFLSLAIFFCGALLFSIGGMVGTASNLHSYKVTIKSHGYNIFFVDKVLKYGLIAQVIIAPLYINQLLKISASAHAEGFLMGVREVTSTGEEMEIGFGIYAYVVAAMSFFTMVTFVEIDNTLKKTVRAYLYLFITLTYHVLSGARTGAVALLITIYFINRFKSIKTSIKSIIISVTLFVIIFSIPAVLLKKGGNIDNSILVNIGTITESIRNYIFPSLVAFDINLQNNPPATASQVFRSLFAIANALGTEFELPNPVLGYIWTPIITNLYTIYYYYYGLGLFAFAAIMYLLGIISTLLYRQAAKGIHHDIILYSLFASCLILSGVADPFLAASSYWIQAVIIIMAIYKYPIFKNNISIV